MSGQRRQVKAAARIFVPNGLIMGYKHNKAAIIERGAELFRKKGYHQVGINEILRVCAIPKGSFYNFFDSKADFARQALMAYGSGQMDMIRQVLRREDLSPLNRLKSFYRLIIEANERDGLDAGCLVNNMGLELGGQDSQLAATANRQFEAWITEIARCIQAGQRSGEIVDDLPARSLAEYLHAGIYGAFSRMKVTRSRTYLDQWHELTFRFIAK